MISLIIITLLIYIDQDENVTNQIEFIIFIIHYFLNHIMSNINH